MSKMKYFVIGFVFAIGLLGFGIVLAQSSSVPLLGKSVISISQQIPVIADLVIPLDDGDVLTTTVPFTVEVDFAVSISGVTVERIDVEEESVPQPTVEVFDAEKVPGMVDIDELGVPYRLDAPDGLFLDKWNAEEDDEGGIRYSFDVTTPKKKFDSDITVRVSYYDDNEKRLGGSGSNYLFSKSAQDKRTRSYDGRLTCEWGNCAGVIEQASYYIIEIEVDLIDLP